MGCRVWRKCVHGRAGWLGTEAREQLPSRRQGPCSGCCAAQGVVVRGQGEAVGRMGLGEGRGQRELAELSRPRRKLFSSEHSVALLSLPPFQFFGSAPWFPSWSRGGFPGLSSCPDFAALWWPRVSQVLVGLLRRLPAACPGPPAQCSPFPAWRPRAG